MRKRLVPMAIVAAAVAMLALVAAGRPTVAAWANPAYLKSGGSSGAWFRTPWYGQVRLDGTTMCLDVPSRADTAGLTVQLYQCNSTPAQIWSFDTDASIRVYEAVGINAPGDAPTVLCLRQNGNSGNATIESCTGTLPTTKKWTVTMTAGTVQIKSQANTTGGGLCLDVPSTTQTQGTVVQTGSCTANGRARAWVLEPVSPVVY